MGRSRFSPPDQTEPPARPFLDLNAYFARLDARLDEIEARLFELEERGVRHRPRYASPDELALEYGIKDTTMRAWLFARTTNGLEALTITQGRRIYLDREEFARWFGKGQGARKERGAVAARADRTLERLDAAGQEEARRLFVRLVQTSPTTGGLENTRRRAALQDLGPDSRGVIQAFAAPEVRLVVTAQDETGAETVEVAHERLIAAWNRLQGWLEEDVEFRLWRQRLEPSLRHYNRDPTNLLTGAALTEARTWLDRAGDELTPMERKLVEASLARFRRQKRWRKIGVAAGLAVMLALAMLAFGSYTSERKARREEARAQRESARTSYTAALAEIDAERWDRALPHLAKAIRLDHDWQVPRDLALSVLQSIPVPRVGMRLSVEEGRRYAFLDESRLLEFVPDGPPRMLDPQTGSERSERPPPGLSEPSNVASVMAGGILTRTDGGETQVWNLATGEPLGPRLTHGPGLLTAWLSPDGKALLAQTETEVRPWNIQTGTALHPAFPHDNFRFLPMWAKDAPRLLTSPSETTLQVWDLTSGKPIGPTLRSPEPFRRAVLSPDGNRIASLTGDPGLADETFSLWNARTGQQLASQVAEAFDLGLGEFSPQGDRLVVSSRTGTARLWNPRTGEPTGVEIPGDQDIQPAQFSADGCRLLTFSLDGSVRGWDAETGLPLGPPMGHPPGRAWGYFYSADRHVFSLAPDRGHRYWQAPAGSPRALAVRRTDGTLDVAISPDGEWIATTGRTDPVSIRNIRTGKIRELATRQPSRATSVEFSPDGNSLLSSFADGTVQIWRPDSARTVVLPQQLGKPWRITFSPDGRWILAPGRSELRLLDSKTGEISPRRAGTGYRVRKRRDFDLAGLHQPARGGRTHRGPRRSCLGPGLRPHRPPAHRRLAGEAGPGHRSGRGRSPRGDVRRLAGALVVHGPLRTTRLSPVQPDGRAVPL
jgi:WD40 repeat protein